MTIQAQIEVLEALAAIDAELKELEDALTQEREALKGKQVQLSGLDERLARSRQSVEEMERTRGELMGEIRQMALQVERSREKLSRCRTERESNAVQRELEELRKLYRDREQEIERIDGLVGQAREEAAQLGKERDELGGELGASEGDVRGRLADQEKALKEKQGARDTLAKRVSPQLYRRYELVRKRRGTAIAHTSSGTCSACHMQLPPMMFQQLLRADEFGQCPSCHRILYFSEAQPEPDPASDSA